MIIERLWLAQQLPELANDLDLAFRRIGREDLANCVWDAEIIEPCPCDYEGCATFYTLPHNPWSGQVECFCLDNVDGLISVFVVNGQLGGVELFGRQDIGRELIRMFSYGWSEV